VSALTWVQHHVDAAMLHLHEVREERLWTKKQLRKFDRLEKELFDIGDRIKQLRMENSL
jgi:hypothetical protein